MSADPQKRQRDPSAVGRLVADVRRGEAGDVAVVLLHGQPGTAGDWQWVQPLIDPRFTVIVPDRPGYGRTGGRATGFGGNALALGGLLDEEGIANAIVVAHSWAGGAAMVFAASQPERVRGLVLASSVGPAEHLGWDDRLLAQPLIGELIAASTIGGLGYLAGWSRVQRLAHRRLHGRNRDVLHAVARLTREGKGVWRSFVTEQRALLEELQGLNDPIRRITAPTVVLHGSRDRLVSPAVARATAEAIAGARLEIIDRAGHLLPHDHPQAIAAAVAGLAR